MSFSCLLYSSLKAIFSPPVEQEVNFVTDKITQTPQNQTILRCLHLSIGYFLKVSLLEPTFLKGFQLLCFIVAQVCAYSTNIQPREKPLFVCIFALSFLNCIYYNGVRPKSQDFFTLESKNFNLLSDTILPLPIHRL